MNLGTRSNHNKNTTNQLHLAMSSNYSKLLRLIFNCFGPVKDYFLYLIYYNKGGENGSPEERCHALARVHIENKAKSSAASSQVRKLCFSHVTYKFYHRRFLKHLPLYHPLLHNKSKRWSSTFQLIPDGWPIYMPQSAMCHTNGWPYIYMATWTVISDFGYTWKSDFSCAQAADISAAVVISHRGASVQYMTLACWQI